MNLLANGLRKAGKDEEARAVYLAALDVCDKSDKYIILDLLDDLADCNCALGRREDELDNRRQINDKTFLAYGEQHVKTYAAAYRYGVALIEQHYVHNSLLLFNHAYPHALAYRGPGEHCQRLIGLLRRVLTHQFDWSLDDLELDFYERRIVDRLADLPATYAAHPVHCRGMWVISSIRGF